ncbi:hypothetical protein C5Y97_15275 [Blastopirellula marina]|uniref:Uncharacterized protein n=1 Tax=Blastopirellula marina TaxID=124 RepID=A0A2S8FN36_9BACT|nr:hypothetical protein C5Y98_15265 [Blastopirellula marina]PTL43386.1 hypothetical protein C5Y97_15275 [Blastopirellula marina]
MIARLPIARWNKAGSTDIRKSKASAANLLWIDRAWFGNDRGFGFMLRGRRQTGASQVVRRLSSLRRN